MMNLQGGNKNGVRIDEKICKPVMILVKTRQGTGKSSPDLLLLRCDNSLFKEPACNM